VPDTWNDASSLHDGYGVAILRDGKGDNKRALWMMYGRARSHVQDNLLDIGPRRRPGRHPPAHGLPAQLGALGVCVEQSPRSRAPFPYKRRRMIAKPQTLRRRRGGTGVRSAGGGA